MTKMTRIEFILRINELHDEFEFSETSSWRTVLHNKAVGGKPTSKHLFGLAVDCVLDNAKDAPAFKLAVKKVGLKFLDEGDHIHVQV